MVERTLTFVTNRKKGHIIPLNKTMVRLLNRLLAVYKQNALGLIFHTKEGLPYDGEIVGKKFAQHVWAAGVYPKVHLHSLRHSFASNLVKQDAPILIVQDLLGHKKLIAT